MFPSVASAAECTVRSSPHAVPVIELYTSEGCSSCPPADRWLSGLTGAAASGRIVPLAFHVNYWDHIGWKDAFGSDRATERQRAISKAAGARFVYTPQVVLGGSDFPGWRSASWAAALEAIQRRPAKATIELVVRTDSTRGIEVSSTTQAVAGVKADEVVLVIAATQNGLASRVTAGENRGEHLAHDFVVRDFAVHRGMGAATSAFRPAAGWDLARMAVAELNMRMHEIADGLDSPPARRRRTEQSLCGL